MLTHTNSEPSDSAVSKLMSLCEQDPDVRVKNDVSRFVWNSLAAATASGQAKLASGIASPDVETLFSRRDSMSDCLNFNVPLQGAKQYI